MRLSPPVLVAQTRASYQTKAARSSSISFDRVVGYIRVYIVDAFVMAKGKTSDHEADACEMDEAMSKVAPYSSSSPTSLLISSISSASGSSSRALRASDPRNPAMSGQPWFW